MEEWHLDWTAIRDSVNRVVEAQREYRHSLKELEKFNAIASDLSRYGLSPVKRKVVNHVSAKKELFYPAQIARELELCSSYVSKVFKELEDGRWIKSVDNKGYRGRKLYQVTIPVATPSVSSK